MQPWDLDRKSGQKGRLEMLNEKERQAVYDVFVCHKIDTCMDPLAFLDFIQEALTCEIYHIIRENKDKLIPIHTSNIPQLSEVEDMFRTIQILNDCEEAVDMYTLGYYLLGANCSREAQRKYGETHYNFACQLGLANKLPRQKTSLTDLGVAFYYKNNREKKQITNRLILEIPILQYSLIEAEDHFVSMVEQLGKYLSPSTVARRRSNMHNMLKWLSEIADDEMRAILSNIAW